MYKCIYKCIDIRCSVVIKIHQIRKSVIIIFSCEISLGRSENKQIFIFLSSKASSNTLLILLSVIARIHKHCPYSLLNPVNPIRAYQKWKFDTRIKLQ